MKKYFSILVALLMATTMNLQAAERGKFIHVDVSNAKNLKPQLAFCSELKNGEDVTTLLLQTVDVNGYKEFTDDSRLLIRFTDGEMTRLQRVPGSAIQKRKYSKKSGTATISYYESVTQYEVTPEVIDKLKDNIYITKVRVVFQANEHKDYDIVESYQAKMAEDLLKSYLEATQKNRQTHTDTSDEDF